MKSEIGLSMWIDKPRPVPGDLVTIKAEADNSCYLTVISVDAAGVATVLFPNDFAPDNLISAGQPVSVPGAEAPFQLRYKAEGSETILGRCSTSSKPPVGIEHDFERQRFTVLGNWENFIQDTLVTESELRTNPEKAEKARIAQVGGAATAPGSRRARSISRGRTLRARSRCETDARFSCSGEANRRSDGSLEAFEREHRAGDDRSNRRNRLQRKRR